MFIYKFFALVLIAFGLNTCMLKAEVFDKNSKYYFDGSISRQVLENYLDRSVTAGYFLTPGTPENYLFPFREDDIRMIQNIGAKFIGRSIYRWSEESKLSDPAFLKYAKRLIDRMHELDPEIIFQACIIQMISHLESSKTYRSYFANTQSVACPVGFSQEETIKEIWNTRLK